MPQRRDAGMTKADKRRTHDQSMCAELRAEAGTLLEALSVVWGVKDKEAMLAYVQLMAFVDGVRYADGRWNCSNCGVDIVGVLAKLVLVENAESAARTRCRLCAEWDFSPENKVVELEGQGGRKESWVLRKTLTLEDVMHLKRIIRRMVDDGYNFQAKVAGALDFGLEEVKVVAQEGVGVVVLEELLTPGHTFTPQEFQRQTGGESSGGPSAVALLKKGWVGRLQLWCEGNRELWHPEVRKEFEEVEKVWKASWVDGMRKGVSAFRTVTVVVNTTAETFSSPHFDWTGTRTLLLGTEVTNVEAPAAVWVVCLPGGWEGLVRWWQAAQLSSGSPAAEVVRAIKELEKSGADGLGLDVFKVVWQKHGELVCFPPGCMHVVVHLQAAVKIASAHLVRENVVAAAKACEMISEAKRRYGEVVETQSQDTVGLFRMLAERVMMFK